MSLYAAAFTEPVMLDYTNYPIFHVQTQRPNILIILDNSGSMNFNAYGSWPGDGGMVPEGFEDPSDCGLRTTSVVGSVNDSEQYTSSGAPWYNSDDLDLGAHSYGTAANSIVGLRFTGINIPKGRQIIEATITFTPYETSTGSCSLEILGEKTGYAEEFTTTSDDLKNRLDVSPTDAVVNWNSIPQWTAGTVHDNSTIDVTTIVQEITSLGGWTEGNAMAFLITGTGKRNARAFDYGDGSDAPKLSIKFKPLNEDCNLYYGYFDGGRYDDSGNYVPAKYFYNSNGFDRCGEDNLTACPADTWDGNWLNWCTMRRVDVLRKVLVGGQLVSAQGTGAMRLRAEDPAQTSRTFYRRFDGSYYPDATPYDYEVAYNLQGGYLEVWKYNGATNTWYEDAQFNLEVQKYPELESYEFNEDGSAIVGIMQSVGAKARWGNMWFQYDDGGKLSARIQGGNQADMIADLGKEPCDTNTPVAEALTTAMYYYMQKEPPTGRKFTINDEFDPFISDEKGKIECAKSFVLLFTDGASTQDRNVPAYLQNTDSDTHESDRSWASNGSDYLDDVAYYGRITDLRPSTPESAQDKREPLDGLQNVLTYVVYAFDNDPQARQLLKETAINGGFYDMDGDNKPDSVGDARGGQWADIGHNLEWDKNGDGSPDNYYEAQNGYKLKNALIRAINDILKRAASGTAVSVLATKGEGEGTMAQAFFKPVYPTLTGEINWLGFMQVLWVDRFGLTREDSDNDFGLDIYTDKVIEFFLDEATGETKVRRYTPDPNDPYSTDNATEETILLEGLSPIWEAGTNLSVRDPDTRDIFTYLNSAHLDFTLANASTLSPYLGVEDDTTWGNDAGLGATEDNRVKNIIRFVRGVPDPDLAGNTEYQGSPRIRRRTNDDGNLWRLGDIVNSTPVTVSKPVENYGLLYDDLSYWNYYSKHVNRETVIYVGANDGMLHAFTGGVYNAELQKFEPPSSTYLSDMGNDIAGNVVIGDELWGYIPKCLLPHLKWLPQTEYTHVSYVDLKVRITDAKIFTADDLHPGGWGTVLLGGLNLGGKDIPTRNAGDFKPTIFAIDVTNPRDPQVMWEQSFADLGLSTNTPAIIRVGGEWKLVIASGPTDFTYDDLTGELTIFSDQNAHAYVVDMATGSVERDYTITGNTYSDSYLSSPVAFDKSLNYNVDSVFMGCTYDSNSKGAIFKITVPQTGTTFNSLAADDDYNTDPSTWADIKLFALAPEPVTAPFTLSIDVFDNVWVYGGTGRYIDQPDKFTTDQHYLFGIKDPFFNKKYDTEGGGYMNYADEANIDVINSAPNANDLFEADPYTITSGGAVSGVSGITTWAELLLEARDPKYDGWYRSMCPGAITSDGACGSGPSERILNKPAILGGIVLLPTFSPSTDVCGFGGNGRLWALYYETGTAYKARVFGDLDQEIIQDVMYLGEGISSSFGVHIGREEGGTIFGQMSTGVIQRIDITPAFNPKSQPTYWKDYFEED